MPAGGHYPFLGLQAYLSMMRTPCDRGAAVALISSVASNLRVQGVLLAALGAAALAGGLWALSLAPGAPGLPPQLQAIAVLVNVLVAAAVGWLGVRSYSLSGDLARTARAIQEGRLGRDEYCGKSLLEVLYTARLRGWPPP